MLLVHGRVVFGESMAPPAGGVAYVRLEDVSRCDAPAEVWSQTVVRDFDPNQTPPHFAFALHGALLDPRRRYVVRALVDLDGDARAGSGDYVSSRAYPITADDTPVAVTITLTRVT